MSKYKMPEGIVKTDRYWAVVYREEFRDSFNRSYDFYCQTGKVTLEGKELELR